MQVLCGLQVVFFLFNCQTPVRLFEAAKDELLKAGGLQQDENPCKISSLTHSKRKKRYNR